MRPPVFCEPGALKDVMTAHAAPVSGLTANREPEAPRGLAADVSPDGVGGASPLILDAGAE
jgi:hypothetical protein